MSRTHHPRPSRKGPRRNAADAAFHLANAQRSLQLLAGQADSITARAHAAELARAVSAAHQHALELRDQFTPDADRRAA